MSGEITTRFSNVKSLAAQSAATKKKDAANVIINQAIGKDGERFLDLGSGTTFILDWSKADMFRVTPTGDFTISFTGTPGTGIVKKIVIAVVNGSAWALTLPPGGSWGSLGAVAFGTGTDLLSVLMANGEAASSWMGSFPS